MKLIDSLREVDKWSLKNKSLFFEKIGEGVPIGVRMIIERNEITELQKVQAVRLLSEFLHEMNKLKNSIISNVGYRYELYEVFEYIKFIADSKDKLVASEISFCIKEAFEAIKSPRYHRIEQSKLEPSIYKLFENSNFDSSIVEIIGKENLNNLEGFILGYFYAIDSNELKIHVTKRYPDLKNIDDWINNKSSVNNWKYELEKYATKNPIEEFLKRYRNFIIEEEE